MNRPTDRRDLVIAAALGVATLAWWSTFLSVGFVLTDEGITNLAGLRILRGELPFADFFLPYFPGYALWLAGAFQLLGEQLLSARIAWCVFAVARTMVAYLVARRLAPRGPALVAALLAMTLVGPSWKVPVATLFLFGLLAAFAISNGRASRAPSSPGPWPASRSGSAGTPPWRRPWSQAD